MQKYDSVPFDCLFGNDLKETLASKAELTEAFKPPQAATYPGRIMQPTYKAPFYKGVQSNRPTPYSRYQSPQAASRGRRTSTQGNQYNQQKNWNSSSQWIPAGQGGGVLTSREESTVSVTLKIEVLKAGYVQNNHL